MVMMKMQTQENIRKMEFLSSISAYLLTKMVFNDDYTGMLISQGLIDIYFIDIILSEYTERLASDYKALKKLYNVLVNNTGKFYEEISKDPIDIFTLYVYMYRNGYLSHDKQFTYSTHPKDFANLHGIDVVTGYGVCKNIASMLTDIYNSMGYKSKNLSVNVNPDDIKGCKDHEFAPLRVQAGTHNATIYKVASNLKHLGNHQILMVDNGEFNYLLDPTNYLFLSYVNGKMMIEDTDKLMHHDHINDFLISLFGQDTHIYNSLRDRKMIKKPGITYQEYVSKRDEMIAFCMANPGLFQEFYQDNLELIDEIYGISSKQHEPFKRKLAIIPQNR